MEGCKDISEMSFEEFFSEKDRMPIQMVRPETRHPRQGGQRGEIQTWFGSASPKINYKDGRFLLYIPRYTSNENARFEVAVDCAEGVIPLGRLESAPRAGGRVSRATTLDLTSSGVSPLSSFTLTIDGADAYRHKPRSLLFFNNIGLPIGKPVGETYVVHAKGTSMRVIKTKILDTIEVGDAIVTRAEVSVAGGVWLNERRHERRRSVQEPVAKAPADEQVLEEEASREDLKLKAKPKRRKAKGSLKIPAGVQEAEAAIGGERLQIHRRIPSFSVSVENCEPSECTVFILDPLGAEVTDPVQASASMTIETGADGLLEIVLSKDGQRIASQRLVVIPDFECSRPGRGDIPPETRFTYTVFGETGEADIYDGPTKVSRNGVDMSVVWNIPAVIYDIGAGPMRFSSTVMDVGDLGDTLVVTVTGARKKALFLGTDKGKKRDITPDWTDDTYRVPLDMIKNEIYSSNVSEFTIYITVNSFPMKRFMTIRNPPRMSARFENGSVVTEVSQTSEYVCRVFLMDMSVMEIALSPGENHVPVSADAVEAEIIEIRNGRNGASIPVSIRPLPFLWRDETSEYWLYISKSKRIPLPGDLVSGGRPDAAHVRAWHDQITRMNPELKDVTTQMMQRAFDEAKW